ncbi:hypothetical protein AAVH_10752 [Aphelenchoides avenae]|nr:hypothetical protein AAVH_10752 [Aphelenchus avenae]
MRRFPSSIEGILLRYLAANPTPDGGPRSECNRPSTLVPGPPVTTTAGVAPTEQPLQQCRNMLFDVCRSSDSAEDMERCKEKCRSLRYANGTCLALPPSAQLGAAVCFCAGDLFPSGYIDRQHILGAYCPNILSDACLQKSASCEELCRGPGYADGTCVFGNLTVSHPNFENDEYVVFARICVCSPPDPPCQYGVIPDGCGSKTSCQCEAKCTEAAFNDGRCLKSSRVDVQETEGAVCVCYDPTKRASTQPSIPPPGQCPVIEDACDPSDKDASETCNRQCQLARFDEGVCLAGSGAVRSPSEV